MIKFIVDTIFIHTHISLIKKHKLDIRKIVSKILKKFGAPYLLKLMPEKHRPMI